MKLTAMLPVLYRSVQYEAGDVLPADDQATVAAWIEAGSAKWLEDEEAKTAPKAKPVTAQPGLTGLSSDGDHEALVGRIPDEPKRKRGGKKS